ncbi:MAG: hypothetical protein JXB32_21405 [Deltaproteobacteria bacterium]|nr:hypothetical protein [Deltaproteobacteria bacterium]
MPDGRSPGVPASDDGSASPADDPCAEPGGPERASFAAAGLRLLLCRLSTYEQVLPSVTHRALLWAARRVPGVHADVAYRPPEDGRPRREDGPPAGWVAAGCGEPARRFDLLGITLTIPQEALNLPRLLHASGIPLGRAARAADPTCPLVVLGGHSAAVVPFLHGAVAPDDGADEGLVDAVVVGDGLGALPELLAALRQPAARARGRDELLRALAARIPGLYVPSLVEHLHRRGRLVELRPRTNGVPFPTPRRSDPPELWRGYDGAFIPWSEELDEETLPVAFACPRRCRFCRDGWCSGPYRETDPDLVVELAARLKASLAAVDLNLLSSDLGCRRDLLPLLARLLELYPRLSAKSLSGISLVRSPMLPALLPRLGKRELTVGVEGASARLRTYLGKRFDPWTLPGRIGPMARDGLRQLKLFFIATGLEREDDLDELGRLLAALRREAPRLRLLVSVMPLFPAPATPLGFAPLLPLDEACRALADTARTAGAEARLSAGPAEVRALALLTRAGRAATPTLVRASLEYRIAFDAGVREGDAALLERMLADAGFDLRRLAAELPARAALPWDDIDFGVPRRTLRREYDRARAELVGTAAAPADEDAEGTPPPGGSRSSVPPAPRTLLRDLPDPFARRRRLGLAFDVRPGAAERPATTLARGALREWFLADDAAARAFAGLGEVLGVPGSAGLRLAAVEFAEGFAPRLPAARVAGPGARPAEPRALLDRLPERPWFLARAPDDGRFGALRELVAALRPTPRHRVERTPAGRRLLVDKGFWNRCGLAAAHAVGDELQLFLGPAAGPLVRSLAGTFGPPRVVAALAADDGPRCPACRSPAFALLASGEALPALVCPACGAPTATAPATPR